MTRYLGRRLARLEKGAGMKRSVMLVVEKLDGLDVDAELAAQGRNIGPDDELVVVATGVPPRDTDRLVVRIIDSTQ